MDFFHLKHLLWNLWQKSKAISLDFCCKFSFCSRFWHCFQWGFAPVWQDFTYKWHATFFVFFLLSCIADFRSVSENISAVVKYQLRHKFPFKDRKLEIPTVVMWFPLRVCVNIPLGSMGRKTRNKSAINMQQILTWFKIYFHVERSVKSCPLICYCNLQICRLNPQPLCPL